MRGLRKSGYQNSPMQSLQLYPSTSLFGSAAMNILGPLR